MVGRVVTLNATSICIRLLPLVLDPNHLKGRYFFFATKILENVKIFPCMCSSRTFTKTEILETFDMSAINQATGTIHKFKQRLLSIFSQIKCYKRSQLPQ